jgi:hypothetical protein
MPDIFRQICIQFSETDVHKILWVHLSSKKSDLELIVAKKIIFTSAKWKTVNYLKWRFPLLSEDSHCKVKIPFVKWRFHL